MVYDPNSSQARAGADAECALKGYLGAVHTREVFVGSDIAYAKWSQVYGDLIVDASNPVTLEVCSHTMRRDGGIEKYRTFRLTRGKLDRCQVLFVFVIRDQDGKWCCDDAIVMTPAAVIEMNSKHGKTVDGMRHIDRDVPASYLGSSAISLKEFKELHARQAQAIL